MIALAIMVYQPGEYTMLSKYGNCTRLFKIKNKLKIGCFSNKVALVGYEIIMANEARSTSNAHSWNNC